MGLGRGRCERYGCDGLHFPVVQYSDRRSGEVRSRVLIDEEDERTCEFENVPDGKIATLAYTRCFTCNPERERETPAPPKVLAGVGAASASGVPEGVRVRLPYADH